LSIETDLAQTQFLQRGGVLSRAIAKKMETGEMSQTYTFREYPKMLRISKGVHSIECTTENVKGKTLEWTEQRELFDEIIVATEEEEERVLSGGRTSAQIEQERLDLIGRCRNAGLRVDPTWSSVRLRRELGDAMDAPPGDEEAQLQAELAKLRRMREMRAEIAALQAEIAEAPAPEVVSDEIEDLRVQLRALGIKPDLRWGEPRLRGELDKATAPDRGAA